MRNKKGDMETNFEVRSFDIPLPLDEYKALNKFPLYIVLDNLRSAFNVGSIFRLCDTMRVKGLYLCGYTAYPPHKKLEKTSLGTLEYVPWKHFDTVSDAIDDLRHKGVEIWGAETTSRSVDYKTVDYPEELAIIFGNEALGVEKETLNICDKLVEIPTYGFKNSLNVATSVAVIGYEAIHSLKRKKPQLYD